MSATALKWARLQMFPSWRHKSALMAVAWFADAKGVAWPSQASLATHTGMSLRTVRRALHDLEVIGVISRQSRSSRAGRLSDVMVLSMHRTFALAKPKQAKKLGQQPAKNVSATGHGGRGIVREQEKELSQNRNNSELVVGDTHEQRKIGWQPVVVNGGRS